MVKKLGVKVKSTFDFYKILPKVKRRFDPFHLHTRCHELATRFPDTRKLSTIPSGAKRKRGNLKPISNELRYCRPAGAIFYGHRLGISLVSIY